MSPLQQRDGADELPPLSLSDEVMVWRDWYISRHPGDPLREWARRKLVKAGLIEDEPRAPEAEDHASRFKLRRPRGYRRGA